MRLRDENLFDIFEQHGGQVTSIDGVQTVTAFENGSEAEHLWTRRAAALFALPHVAHISIALGSAGSAETMRSLESLLPMDVIGLEQGRQQFGVMCNEVGGITSDLMIAHLGDELRLSVSSIATDSVLAALSNLPDCDATLLSDHVLLALHGPRAGEVLGHGEMRRGDIKKAEIGGTPVLLARSGYMAEDGFEMTVSRDKAGTLASILMAHETVMPAGFAAYETLRLEAGHARFGWDISPEITPIEAALHRQIPKVRREGGARAGGFAGSGIIMEQMSTRRHRKRVGILPHDKAVFPAGTALFAQKEGQQVGIVTSGGMGHALKKPVSMGYIPSQLARNGAKIFGVLGDELVPAMVANLPFVFPKYKN